MQELNKRHIYFTKYVKKLVSCSDIVFRRKSKYLTGTRHLTVFNTSSSVMRQIESVYQD